MPGVPWPTIMLGETIITDAEGAIVDRLAYADGEGWICADVRWEDARAARPRPAAFWMTTLPLAAFRRSGTSRTPGGGSKYLAKHALRRHPWQDDPAYGRRPPRRHSPPGEPAGVS